MKKNYDFSGAKRGAVIASHGKSRITLWLDDDILEVFRAHAQQEGRGYQTLINERLRAAACKDMSPLTAEELRRVLREELRVA
ncbi:MAG: BrnA antitoxin family protein [Zoogloeaceae bacterium]|jgi:uncharacterized protein (DUF4415 family)|nr:BrnA antitoxin family protein [Zoogloeaceae bacterium]